jgi:hypothetical protein
MQPSGRYAPFLQDMILRITLSSIISHCSQLAHAIVSDSNTLRFLKENKLPFVAKPFDQKILTGQVNKILGKTA